MGLCYISLTTPANFFAHGEQKQWRVRRIDELGKDNLAELDNTENNRLSAGTKQYVAT